MREKERKTENPNMSLSCTFDELGNEPMSFEDEVFDLTKKIANLQEQVSALNDVQATNENRYCKVKQENASLLSKIHALEEHVRDIEIQSEDRRLDDEKRFKDVMARYEREKAYENDQYLTRIYDLQQELLDTREELRRNQLLIEKLKSEKFKLIDELNGKCDEIVSLNEKISYLNEQEKRHQDEDSANSLVIDVLNQELDELRKRTNEKTKLNCNANSSNNNNSSTNNDKQHLNGETSDKNKVNCDYDDEFDDKQQQLLNEMKNEIKLLRNENRTIRESNEELQAQLLNNHLEEGRSLIKAGEAVSSLANELGNFTIEQLRTMLKEQQDCNAKLRSYIDGILLNIVENYPQLLEVKSK